MVEFLSGQRIQGTTIERNGVSANGIYDFTSVNSGASMSNGGTYYAYGNEYQSTYGEIGKTFNKWSITWQRNNSPQGVVEAQIYTGTEGSTSKTWSQTSTNSQVVDSTSTSDTSYAFTFANSHTISAGDVIVLVWKTDTSTSGSNYINIRLHNSQIATGVRTYFITTANWDSGKDHTWSVAPSPYTTYGLTSKLEQTAISGIDNVPVGTRFEETDTRKIYRRAKLNLNSKLKVYWKFDATTGNYVNKASTVGSPDSITADITTVSATRDATGILDNAISFNGSSNYALANGSASDWSFLFNKKMSVSFWLNNTMGSTSAGHTLFSTSTAEGGGGFYIDVIGSGGMRVIWQGSSFDNDTYSLTGIVDSSTGWHHFVVTYDSGTTTVFKDGSSVGSSTSYSDHQGFGSDTQNVMIIGCNHKNDGGRDYYTEFMTDEMAFWGDRALTSNEVVDLYNSGSALAITSTTPSDPLLYGWVARGVAS